MLRISSEISWCIPKWLHTFSSVSFTKPVDIDPGVGSRIQEPESIFNPANLNTRFCLCQTRKQWSVYFPALFLSGGTIGITCNTLLYEPGRTDWGEDQGIWVFASYCFFSINICNSRGINKKGMKNIPLVIYHFLLLKAALFGKSQERDHIPDVGHPVTNNTSLSKPRPEVKHAGKPRISGYQDTNPVLLQVYAFPACAAIIYHNALRADRQRSRQCREQEYPWRLRFCRHHSGACKALSLSGNWLV